MRFSLKVPRGKIIQRPKLRKNKKISHNKFSFQLTESEEKEETKPKFVEKRTLQSTERK